MTKFYRFRSIDKLLNECFQELEQQAIFFAAEDKLNDPMEGFRDLVWDGDRIVWYNLLKHYVYCLHWSFQLALVSGDEHSLKPGDIQVERRWDSPPTPQSGELFDKVWASVSHECELEDLAKQISGLTFGGIKHKLRRSELLIYLQSVHRLALRTIQEVFIERNLMDETEGISLIATKEALFTRLGLFDLLPQIPQINTSSAAALFRLIENEFWSIPLRRRFDPKDTGRENSKFLVFDYPAIYIEELRRLLWPERYTACFVKDFHNSSLWANYGDGHRGACLIFEADEEDGQAGLKLKQVTGGPFSRAGGSREHWDFVPRAFDAVRYQVKPDEVDFFRSMGQPRGDALVKLWYTDENGDLSDCSTQVLGPNSDIAAWQKAYWDNFARDACFKTKDWEYEQEFRLTLHSILESSLCPRKRTLPYDFDSLKGIVFGIKTSYTDKLEIIDLLSRKCRENQRTDFRFLQAYYSPETGDIRSDEIWVDPTAGSDQYEPD